MKKLIFASAAMGLLLSCILYYYGALANDLGKLILDVIRVTAFSTAMVFSTDAILTTIKTERLWRKYNDRHKNNRH